MMSVLGKMRKFGITWNLIDEMRGGKVGPSLVNPQTLLIMIRKYCAVHDVGKAINTFYVHKRFNFEIGIKEFQDLLSALCWYKNVQDAEHLLFCNEKAYPLNTKSFNIILNGWCNMLINLGKVKRFWRLMGKKGIHLGVSLDRKVYNAVIYALAKGKHVKEAFDLMKTMEEKGIMRSRKFQEMRAKQDLPHTCSRQGYARLEDKMRKESSNPSFVTRVDVWFKGHTKKSGEPSNAHVAKKMLCQQRPSFCLFTSWVVFNSLFGLSRSFWMAIVTRFLLGTMSGLLDFLVQRRLMFAKFAEKNIKLLDCH
ncbi:hypothetical protein IFM89_029907 [Coptis chinensis]|uniref:Pentatricopeptide repeat-containing protein n=1 Tax=Coptis chinensis TaxID=261450 RepID=A0A835LN55_9MAGN|nr:hypothetical protein IFM89_029907 [Coptis chinensis]